MQILLANLILQVLVSLPVKRTLKSLGQSGISKKATHKDAPVKYAKTFNIAVIRRILSTLHEHGQMKMTNLAGKTGMNYSKCVKYINLLGLLGWVEVFSGKNRYVIVTDKGMQVNELFSNVLLC